MQWPRRTHLPNPDMHAPSARMSRRKHLLNPKDARVQHGARADGCDTRLLLSQSSAGGYIFPETDLGDSILSEVDVGGCISPGTYEHVRSARQEPSTRRKSRPRRRKSSRTCIAQHDPLTSPVPDLREQLNKKQSADQVTPHCRCERIITSVLADCTCSSPTHTKSVFECISATSPTELIKRLRFNDEDIPSEDEFIEVSIN